MTVRYYSSVAPETTLVGTITSSATSITLASAVGLPALTPFTVALDYEGPSEELVNVTAVAGATLTVTRGIDGTGATSHSSGARVRHVTSARDFTDSRNHENSIAGVHGLAPGEDIVGTDSPQTLSNKTFVNATGSLLNVSINSTGTNTTRIGGDDGGTNIVEFRDQTADPNPVAFFTANGGLFIRNRVADDTVPAQSKIRITKSDGTTNVLQVQEGGTVAATLDQDRNGFQVTPNAASAASNRTYTSFDANGSTVRFAVFKGGNMAITSSDPTQPQLRIRAAPGQVGDIFQIQDSTGAALWVSAANDGRWHANAGLNAIAPSDGAVAAYFVPNSNSQTAALASFRDGSGNTIAFVDPAGNYNRGAFHTNNISVGSQATAGTGWSLTASNVVTKAGWVMHGYSFLRTGATLTPGANGNIVGEPIVCTLNAAYRPTSLFGGRSLVFETSDGAGAGAVGVSADTGLVRLSTWSTGGSIPTGNTIRVNFAFPID